MMRGKNSREVPHIYKKGLALSYIMMTSTVYLEGSCADA